MKWYSVKTHIPLDDLMVFVRVLNTKNFQFYCVAFWDDPKKEWCFGEGPVSDKGLTVTHFCIPEPVEIED